MDTAIVVSRAAILASRPPLAADAPYSDPATGRLPSPRPYVQRVLARQARQARRKVPPAAPAVEPVRAHALCWYDGKGHAWYFAVALRGRGLRGQPGWAGHVMHATTWATAAEADAIRLAQPGAQRIHVVVLPAAFQVPPATATEATP